MHTSQLVLAPGAIVEWAEGKINLSVEMCPGVAAIYSSPKSLARLIAWVREEA